MIETLRSRAILGAIAAVLAVAGLATSFAAAGSTPGESEPRTAVSSSLQTVEPEEFIALSETLLEPEANGDPNIDLDAETPDDEGTDGLTEALGVPADSPACDNLGCAEVETPGGVTVNVPQPAADGMARAAENRAAAQAADDDVDEADEPVEPAEDEGDDEGEATVRGVTDDSPACEKHGCANVETPGGVTVNVPQPAADGMARAAENREAAQSRGNGNGGDDEPPESEETAVQSAANDKGGKPDWAGPPAGRGPNR